MPDIQPQTVIAGFDAAASFWSSLAASVGEGGALAGRAADTGRDTFVIINDTAAKTFASLRASLPRFPFHASQGQELEAGVLIVYNPVAHNGATEKIVDDLVFALRETQAGITVQQTNEDPQKRISEIVTAINEMWPFHRRLVVIAIGGDRTADDVLVAVHNFLSQKMDGPQPDVSVIAGPGGTANDLRRITGAPSDVRGLIEFINSAEMVDFYGLELEYMLADGATRQARTFFGTTWGISGETFIRFEDKKNQAGRVSLADALSLIPFAITHAKTIYVALTMNSTPLNGGRPIPAGEVFGPIVIQELGRFWNLPMPPYGARIFLPPPMPYLLMPLAEGLLRGALIEAGVQLPAVPDGRLLTMARQRHIDLPPSSIMEMKFLDEAGKPIAVKGTLAGDSHAPVTSLKITGMARPVPILAAPDSNLMVQTGMAAPSLFGSQIAGSVLSLAASAMNMMTTL